MSALVALDVAATSDDVAFWRLHVLALVIESGAQDGDAAARCRAHRSLRPAAWRYSTGVGAEADALARAARGTRGGLSQRVRAAVRSDSAANSRTHSEHCAEAPLTAVRSMHGRRVHQLVGLRRLRRFAAGRRVRPFPPRPRSRNSRREERSPAASSCCGGGTRRQPPPRSPPPPRGTAKHARLGAAQGVPCAHSRSRSPASGRTSARVRSSRARRGVRRAWA